MLRLYVREGQGGRVQDNPRYAGGPQTGEKFVIFWCGVCFRLYKRCRDFHTGGGHGERIAVIAYLPHRHRAPTHVRDGDALQLVPCGGGCAESVTRSPCVAYRVLQMISPLAVFSIAI